MKQKRVTRLWAALLALVMVLGMVPTAFAATGDTKGSVELNKSVTLEDDGTYTINLEAFSTGTTITTVSTQPTDVVLVLDVSGSMDDDFSYVTGQDWQFTTKKVRDHPTNVYHKCSDGTWGTIIWSVETVDLVLKSHRYVCQHCHATRQMTTPLSKPIPGAGDKDPWNLYEYTNVTTTRKKMEALQEAVKAFIDGVNAKNEALTDSSQHHRVCIVKFADDSFGNGIGNDFNGSYNYTQVIYGMTAVNDDTALEMKNAVDALTPNGATAIDYGMNLAQQQLASTPADRAKVVIAFTDGSPTHSNGFQESVANDAIGYSKSLKDNKATVYSIGVLSDSDVTTNMTNFMNGLSSNYPQATSISNLGSGSDQGYYERVQGQLNLTDIFTEISTDIGTTTVTLNAESITKDILADGFVLTDNTTVTTQTAAYTGRDRDGNRLFAAPVAFNGAIETDKATGTVSVKGFDFSKDYLTETYNSNGTVATTAGKKLLITITGVEATDAAVTNADVFTNNAASGVYQDAASHGPTAVFPRPTTKLTSAAYVLDYAQPITLNMADWQANSIINLDSTGMHQFSAGLTSVNLNYGALNSNVYTPNTMKWAGYDRVYAFGKSTANANQWSRITVLPATSVYYEDTFVTSDNTAGSTFGIQYSGSWTEVGTASGNTETTGPVQGWTESLADDKQFSDGIAHQLSNGATAEFTFTGTGVDVYSHTNANTGMVRVKLFNADTQKILYYNLVNNESVSGDYYQIPTVFFDGLKYGTYTVEITAYDSTSTDLDNNRTYYLDGIRVYNPINPETSDPVVGEAYGEQNIAPDAIFTSLRDLLIDSAGEGTTSFNGALFIDKVQDSTGVSSNVVADYVEYGPKNEIYLAAGQSVTFNFATENIPAYLYIGMKAPTGNATTAAFSGVDANGAAAATTTIDHSTDLYYEVFPAEDGNVVITNTGRNLLAITKMAAPDLVPPESEGFTLLSDITAEMAVEQVNAFSALPTVEYTGNTKTEAPAEPEQPTEPGNSGDVEIENPEQPVEPEKPVVVISWLNKLFSALRNCF